MPTAPAPEDVPVYRDPDVRDRHYHEAETAGVPYLAVERYEEGYAVTFDLMPAGVQLTATAQTEVRDCIRTEVEAVVADANAPETEVSHNVGAALGSIAAFEAETTAQSIAASVGAVVLEEDNWETHRPPEGGGVDVMSND